LASIEGSALAHRRPHKLDEKVIEAEDRGRCSYVYRRTTRNVKIRADPSPASAERLRWSMTVGLANASAQESSLHDRQSVRRTWQRHRDG
jgi:hypothetical protein